MEAWKLDADPLQFFTGEQNLKWFLAECWEKKFHHFKADEARKAVLDGLFTCASLADILKKREQPGGPGPFVFGLDLNAAKYVNGVRETPNGEVGDSETVWGLFENGATLQIIQPQRFQEDLQAICAALESRLGCLVGCNAYLTPKGTQGLAPHHDDVELFVCQTQGTKTWRLHKEVDGFKLPSQPSGNLTQDIAGKPISEVTLQVGDVLYLPRGTVHQAVAQDEPSVHLTISTYQKWTWGDLALTMMQHALQAKDSSTSTPLCLREGLPLGFVSTTGALTGSTSSAKHAAREASKRLREFADELEEKEHLLNLAVDNMAEDVCTNRMPPLDNQMPEKGPKPKLRDTIRPRGRGLFRLMPIEMESGEIDPDCVQLMTCLKNPIHKHMIAAYSSESDNSDSDPDSDEYDQGADSPATHSFPLPTNGDQTRKVTGETGNGVSVEECGLSDAEDSQNILVFKAKFVPALKQVLESGKNGVAISALSLLSDKDKLDCATVLWEDGIVSTQQDSTEAAPKSKRHKKKPTL